MCKSKDHHCVGVSFTGRIASKKCSARQAASESVFEMCLRRLCGWVCLRECLLSNSVRGQL